MAFGSGCGQSLLGVPRKAPLCLLSMLKNGPCPRSFARKKHQGRQCTPPGTCFNLHLDGIWATVVSTDAALLLQCSCAPKTTGFWTNFFPPRHCSSAELDGWPPAAGNQPSIPRVNDSKRRREGPARRGGQVRPGRGCTANILGPWHPLVTRASVCAHNAPGGSGWSRSTPWSYRCGEGEAKGSNRRACGATCRPTLG